MKRRTFLGGALATPAVLYLTGCDDTGLSKTRTTATTARTTGSAPATGGDPSSFSAVEISQAQIDAAIEKLDDIVKHAMDASGVPGLAVAVVHDDKVRYSKGFGVKKVGEPATVDENTVFQIASLSKSVGATAIAGLVGDGKVAWSDPIVKYLPTFALSDPFVTQTVTIGDMYAHRSGLPEHAGDKLEDMGYEQAQVLERLRYEPLEPFRITYEYTNFGMTAGGEAVAKAAGTSWAELSRTRLYQPLGMSSTSSTYADFIARPNHASGNQLVNGKWQPTIEQRQPDAQSPAGGVSSNVVDLARWMRMVLNNGTFEGREIVNAKALAPVLTPQVTSGPPRSLTGRPGSYGYGFNIGVGATGAVRFSHSGAFSLGTATAFDLIPAAKLGIVTLSNGTPLGIPESINAAFGDLALVGYETQDWVPLFRGVFDKMNANTSRLADQKPPASATPAGPSSTYAGTYNNQLYGPAVVTAGADGALTLQLGPKGMTFPLTHWDGNEFSYIPPGENSLGITAVTFQVPATGGKATAVTLENLDENGLGTFTAT